MGMQKDIVTIDIARGVSGLSKAGFGILLMLTLAPGFTSRVKSYTSADDVLDDFDSTSPEYLGASAYFGPDIAPPTLYIGSFQASEVECEVIVATVGATYTVTIEDGENEYSIAYLAIGGDTPVTIASALAAAIASGTPYTTTYTPGESEYKVQPPVAVVGKWGIELDAKQEIGKSTKTEATAVALGAIADENNDWYGLATVYRDPTLIAECAAWAQTADPYKLFGYSSGNVDIPNPTKTTDLASVFQGLGYTRTFGMFKKDADKGLVSPYWVDTDPYAEFAWFGRMFPTDLDISTATWKFKTLIGVSADALTTTEYNTLRGVGPDCVGGKNMNCYVSVGGASIAIEGKVASGEFIDIIMGIDWLTARMTEGVYSAMVNNEKIPFDDGGITIVESVVRQVLKLGIKTQFLRFDSTLGNQGFRVGVPGVDETLAADRANRYFKGMTFLGRIAGAIHATLVQGKVTV